MNYHLHRDGQNLGIFSLENLRQWRQNGRLTGTELVWREGMTQWQPLDSILAVRSATPPPIPKRKTNWLLISGISLVAILMLVGSLAALIKIRELVHRRAQTVRSNRNAPIGARSPATDRAVAVAAKPVTWTENTWTEKEAQKRGKEFRERQYLEGYKLRGEHNPACDAEALGLLENWIATHFGGTIDTNLPSLSELSDKLANNPACTDPLILTVAGIHAPELFEANRRLERAVTAFERSKHKAYPKLYATVSLAGKIVKDRQQRIPVQDASALHWFKEAFADGSFLPEDDAEIAEMLVQGWGKKFFERNAEAVCEIVDAEQKRFPWLARVLKAESEVKKAWKARGSGYSNTVSEQGWENFRKHLAEAEKLASEAWELKPNLPLAASQMIYISLSKDGLAEMRVWFDRAVSAQIDYSKAWSHMRWGLRPRWYGNVDAMLALGTVAVQTKRFDTDVPRIFFDVVSDIESELKLPSGEHIYGRKEIWPHMKTMYEGYINEPSEAESQEGWRNTYSIVAYLAEQYDVSAEQLEILRWERLNKYGWGRDLSLMHLEVAARTGPFGPQVTKAEAARKGGKIKEALRIYKDLDDKAGTDERTRTFVQDRVATLELEKQVAEGDWVNFLPDKNFTGWEVSRGKCEVLMDRTLRIESDRYGHMVFCRARQPADFEVQGEFEVESTSNKAFQAGLVLGLPEFDSYTWCAFRIKRNRDEADIASFSTHWSTEQVVAPITLNDKVNSFHLRFQDGKVTATVNNRPVFTAVEPPENSNLPDKDILLGLGAYNDMNQTVIRYRNVQVKKIEAP